MHACTHEPVHAYMYMYEACMHGKVHRFEAAVHVVSAKCNRPCYAT